MNSDKNYYILEKHLKTLGQKIRLDILTKLDNYKEPISYSVLQKEVLSKNSSSTNFSFHLKTLKRHNLIDSTENGYSLSKLGQLILQKILSIEQILINQNDTLMIRTSKYSKEPFDSEKIEQYLIKEGKLDKNVAKQIAHEVEERLSKTKITYLTTPLMREYINGILLENGLEEARHRLTRLGTPPHEVENYFKNAFLSPEQFINKLGSESSEQFLLLNLLPKSLSDLYLSGDIVLLNLNYWSLRPISIYLDSNSIFNSIRDKNVDQKQLAMKFLDVIKLIKPYISEDILLGHFSTNFLLQFNDVDTLFEILSLIYPTLLEVNNSINRNKSCLTLEFSCVFDNNVNNDVFLINQLITTYINYVKNYNEQYNKLISNPMIMYDYSSDNSAKKNLITILNTNSSKFYRDFVFYNGKSNQLLNSQWINLNYPNKQNKVILDKILINLHKISLESEKKDDLFFDILKERLEQVFELFEFKKQLISKKLENINDWIKICSTILNNNSSLLLDTSIKSISFIGLNEAVEYHCGIELDRIDSSRKFAIKILNFMKKIIKEKNFDKNEVFLLTQPHQDICLHQTVQKDNNNVVKTPSYCPNIIRDNSNLPLDEKIQLFKSFENILHGGSILEINSKLSELNTNDLYDILSKANLNAFRIY